MILTINAIPGATTITDSRLAYADVIKVKHEGTGYDIVYDTPTGRQVQHKKTKGQLIFTNSFNDSSTIYVWVNR